MWRPPLLWPEPAGPPRPADWKQSVCLVRAVECIRGSSEQLGGGGPASQPEAGQLQGGAERGRSTERGGGSAARSRSISRRARALVSKKKLRWVAPGFDLDLSYITPHLIAMGFPSDGTEGIYRNPMGEVQRFLEARHFGRYKVYNLCGERCYPSQHFHNRVAVFGFADHHPPPMALLVDLCQDLQRWLGRHLQNVGVVHCKAGKGRTGLALVCFLLHSGQCATALQAMTYYAERRTRDGKGVTIPCQQRYCEYYATLARRYLQPPPASASDGGGGIGAVDRLLGAPPACYLRSVRLEGVALSPRRSDGMAFTVRAAGDGAQWRLAAQWPPPSGGPGRVGAAVSEGELPPRAAQFEVGYDVGAAPSPEPGGAVYDVGWAHCNLLLAGDVVGCQAGRCSFFAVSCRRVEASPFGNFLTVLAWWTGADLLQG
eukprot:SAG11_NODE_877_length_6761_cov_5.177574_2_plen_430_part_00